MEQKSKILKEVIGLSFLFLFLAGTMCIPGNVILAEASEGYGTRINGGNCGASGNEAGVTWEAYDSNKDEKADTIVFGGSGAMGDFSKGDSPWYGYIDSLTKVVFEAENGITRIGNYAFYDCSSLSSVEIPSGVTSIGGAAFSGCRSLNSMEIPSGVTSIGEYAFSGCSSLSSVKISSGVTSIEEYVFSNCSSLSSVKIPSGVTSIGDGAFQYCSSLNSVEIPSGVTSIGAGAFFCCSSLSSVEIPSGVTSIGMSIFYDCSSLSSVEIPSGVTSIGTYAFKGCSSLSSVEIPSEVTSIGDGAFKGCSSLSSVEIPSGVTSIEMSTFYDCSSLSSVEIPSGVTSIGNYAFQYCSSLSSVEIPSGVTSIGNYAFSGCNNLSFQVEEENKEYSAENGILYSKDKSVLIAAPAATGNMEIPSGVTSIGTYAFYGCSSLSSVEMPSGVTSIGYRAFYGCSSLSSVEIPSGVTSIGEHAFYGCSNMQEFYYPENLNISSAGILATSIQVSYTTNENKVSAKVEYTPENTKNIIIPETIAGTPVSSVTLAEGVSAEAVYYPKDVDISSAGIPATSLQVSYTTDGDNVSLKVTNLPAGTETILLPEKIAGKSISSIDYAQGVDASAVTVECTEHYPATGKWEIDKEAHSCMGCSVCKEDGEIGGNHDYGDGTQTCKCGYKPFTITTQPKEKEWAFSLASEEERKLKVEVSKTLGTENITYQWYENESIVEGATENTYVIPKEKGANSYTYYCEITCGKYSLKSDTVTVSISKAQGMINVEEGKETVVIEYSKTPVSLDWVTKFGDGTLVYTITEGENVLSVSADGKITMAKLGEASISVNMAETENYKQAETKNIAVKVMTHYPATTPDTPVAVENTIKKVSEVSLPEHWEWESEDAKKTLPAGEDLEVTANYTGVDKEFYYNISFKVIIHRATCTGSDILYTGEEEKAPTCIEEGKGHRECTVCGDILESNITVPVIKHTLSKVPGVEAGCTTDGTEVHWSCQVCKKMFADDQGSKEVSENELVIDALGHKGGQADCSKKAVCEVCKKEYGELNKNKHGESEVKNAKEATCTEKGYTGDNCCKDCGEKVSSGKEIQALGHTGGEADCSKKAVCTVCKKEYGELNKDKHGESEVKNAKKATCTEKGYTGDNCCKNCGEKLSSGKEISALGHTGGEADCSRKAVCTVCKKEYGELNKSKHGETELKNAKVATCMEEGYTGDVCCKDCGEIISKGEAIEKTAHIWDGGVITKEATETEKGIKTYTCSTCQETKTEEIPAIGKVVTPEKPGEVVTPEIPKTEVTLTPTPAPTVTQKPMEKPSKEEPKAPKKGTVVTDKKSNAKYKVLVAGKNGTVEYVSPLNKKSTKANIPATITINGITYKVVSIAKNAFKNNKFITKVTIGKNVKTIGANAFSGCKKLKKVTIGKNVTSIGDKAFYKCTALTKITIPSKVKKLGKQTFYGCKKLRTITLKTTKLTKKTVGSKVFTGINTKATIKVPKSKVKAYQKLLKSKGISKTVKVKK